MLRAAKVNRGTICILLLFCSCSYYRVMNMEYTQQINGGDTTYILNLPDTVKVEKIKWKYQ